MDVRREFSFWLAYRQETALEEEDAHVLRFRADELFKHERYFEAYRFYWQLKDEDGKRNIFVALCRGEPDVRKLVLAGMIAKDSGYAMTEIFSIYFSIGTVGSLREAYDLAEDIKIPELQKKCIWALILKTQRSWYDCREYLGWAIKLFIGCRDSENLNKLYPYLLKMGLTEECIKCAEFLGDKTKLMKIARQSFSWFGWFRGKDPDRALKIWEKLGYEKGLKKIQRWAKRRLDERVYSYWQACVALCDEDGARELLEMIVNGPLWHFSRFFWKEVKDLETRRSLARSALARGETELALSWFVKISDKDGIVATLDEAIKKNKIDIDLWRARSESSGDARILSRFKEIYIMRGDAWEAEFCAKEMGQALTRGEYCRIAEAERRERGFVWRETAQKADIVLTSEDWLAKARFLVGTGGQDEDVKEALKKAEELKQKEVEN